MSCDRFRRDQTGIKQDIKDRLRAPSSAHRHDGVSDIPERLVAVRPDRTDDGAGKPASVFLIEPPPFHDIGDVGCTALIKSVRHALSQSSVDPRSAFITSALANVTIAGQRAVGLQILPWFDDKLPSRWIIWAEEGNFVSLHGSAHMPTPARLHEGRSFDHRFSNRLPESFFRG